MIPRVLPLVLVLALALVGAACGNEVSIEGLDDPQVDLDDGGITIEDPAGGITIEDPAGEEVNIGGADYPDGWPADFPVPEGAVPAFSIGADGDVAVWFATAQSAAEINAFYEAALPAAGYTVDSSAEISNPSGGYTALSISGNGWSGGIAMGEGVEGAAVGFSGDFAFWVTLSPTT